MKTIYPWQTTQWQQLQARQARGALPHAMLLTGPVGIGKRDFTHHFSQYLLCQNKTGQACGQCHSCHLMAAGNHPDYLEVMPEEVGKMIKIDVIRKLSEFAVQSSQYHQAKVIVIHPAENMNRASSNALLKTLEEPVENTFIFLISEQASQLMATIRSRCQILALPTPTKALALEYLQSHSIENAEKLLALADGAPLKAMQLAEEDELTLRETLFKDWCEVARGQKCLVKLSEQWIKLDLVRVMWHLLSWMQDVIKIKLLNQQVVLNQDFFSTLDKIAARCDLQKMFLFLDQLSNTRRMLMGQIALNKQLLIENIFVEWVGLVRS